MSRLTVAWVTSKPCAISASTSSRWLPTGRDGDELADRPLAQRASSSWPRRHSRHPRRAARRPAVMRVPKRGSSSARSRASGADESAMIASAPSQPSADSAARILGTMPPAMTPRLDEVLGLGHGQRVELAAVGVAHAVDVGQQHQLAGAETGRDARPPRRRR